MSPVSVNTEDCLAQHSGIISVSKEFPIDNDIEIIRDKWGIPHIKATSSHDIFFAQGYCLGQDRLWQLELFRHLALGRASELLGEGLIRRDQQNRKLGFGRYAEIDWEAQTELSKMILQAYADGINAAATSNPLPYEFHIIGEPNDPHKMHPWDPTDSLAILKMVSANAQWASKLQYGKIANNLGGQAVEALIPDIPFDTSLITPAGTRWLDETHPYAIDSEVAGGEPDGIVGAGGGSNCWVIGGEKTTTGKPLIAGDPHLAISIPAQWYLLHMECPEFTAAGPCSPGYPGPVYYGHNSKVAWTMTHAQGDRWDLYREKIEFKKNNSSSNQIPHSQFESKWEPLKKFNEIFNIKNSESQELEIWETHHGVVISGNPISDKEVIAAKWGLAEPTHDMDALWKVLNAKDNNDLQLALQNYDSISGNYCFADQSGNITYQYVGRIPNRPGWLVPVPGWDGKHEWKGSIPKNELPAEHNPKLGYIVTANNRTTSSDYPYYLSFSSTRFRADRLNTLMENIDVFSNESMTTLQSDILSLAHLEFVQHVASSTFSNELAQNLQARLVKWDGKMHVNSSEAVLANEARNQLAKATVEQYFNYVEGLPPLAPTSHNVLLSEMHKNSTLMLDQFDNWDMAIEFSLLEAYKILSVKQGDNIDNWQWGEEHKITWKHNLGRDPEFRSIFDLDPIAMSGDRNTVWNVGTPLGATGMHGVSYRQILDLKDLNSALVVIPPGNSGQPGSPHYADHIENWIDVKYNPLFVNWDDVQSNKESDLRLT